MSPSQAWRVMVLAAALAGSGGLPCGAQVFFGPREEPRDSTETPAELDGELAWPAAKHLWNAWPLSLWIDERVEHSCPLCGCLADDSRQAAESTSGGGESRRSSRQAKGQPRQRLLGGRLGNQQEKLIPGETARILVELRDRIGSNALAGTAFEDVPADGEDTAEEAGSFAEWIRALEQEQQTIESTQLPVITTGAYDAPCTAQCLDAAEAAGQCAAEHCAAEHCAAGHCAAGHCAAGHCAAERCAAGHCAAGHGVAGQCVAGHSAAHCAAGHCAAEHCAGGACAAEMNNQGLDLRVTHDVELPWAHYPAAYAAYEATAPAPSMDEAGAEHRLDVLRSASAQLEKTANLLEEAELFAESDQVREAAGALRMQARRVVVARRNEKRMARGDR